MNKIRVFEAFSGYGSQSLALKNIGVDFEVVAISEIDKYALKAYEALHGQYNNLGDISKLDTSLVPEHDLLTYSFPCQDVSTSGKQRGLEANSGTRSSLLWECKRIISSKKPKFLLMENVKNLISKRHKPYFDLWCTWLEEQGYTNYYECLNATNFGIPQNRQRVFMVSILGEHKPYTFPSGIPLKHTLRDFLDTTVPEKYYLSDEIQQRFIATKPDKSTNKSSKIIKVGNASINTNSQAGQVVSTDGVSMTITSGTHGYAMGYIEDVPLRNGAIRGRYTPNGNIEQCLELRHDNCTNTLTTVQKDNVIIEPILSPIGILEIKGFRENRLVFCEGGICPTLTTMQGGNRQPKVLENKKGGRIRKLTEHECGRLMGVSNENLEKIQQCGISATQQYKMYGNSIVIPVLEAIFKNLFINNIDYMK